MFKFSGLKPSDIDLVTIGSFNLNPVLLKLKRNAQFSVKDWVDEQEKFWKPKIFHKKKLITGRFSKTDLKNLIIIIIIQIFLKGI